ncbi:uncharacterized protein LOC108735900 [Agrilus planipennis]|uniref:Uncharacterized protein LOC108735900 n=1 Tax=Agrilus planipennis TaxID=224129 RepID=A0A1W4WSZ9_AGRPL|nr:uncharacterized protein LOC108735900 [Agrilus planipennis]
MVGIWEMVKKGKWLSVGGFGNRPTHTDCYLSKDSNHHPAQKRTMLKTVIHRANRICEASLLDQELRHLDQALQSNGYTSQEIKRALHPRRTAPETPQPPPVGFASLPYIKTVTDCIWKLLKRHNIRTFFKPLRTLLRTAKDPGNPLTSAGVYRIPCSCRGVYVLLPENAASKRE